MRGGAHVGPSENIVYGSAMAALTVDAHSLELRVWPFRYRIERGRIRRLLVEIDPLGGWPRLRIVHEQEGVPASIVFIPMAGLRSAVRLMFVSDPVFVEDLQQALERHGYSVERRLLVARRWPIALFRVFLGLALAAAAAGVLAAAAAAIYAFIHT